MSFNILIVSDLKIFNIGLLLRDLAADARQTTISNLGKPLQSGLIRLEIIPFRTIIQE
jgi:hypothetical protein